MWANLCVYMRDNHTNAPTHTNTDGWMDGWIEKEWVRERKRDICVHIVNHTHYQLWRCCQHVQLHTIYTVHTLSAHQNTKTKHARADWLLSTDLFLFAMNFQSKWAKHSNGFENSMSRSQFSLDGIVRQLNMFNTIYWFLMEFSHLLPWHKHSFRFISLWITIWHANNIIFRICLFVSCIEILQQQKRWNNDSEAHQNCFQTDDLTFLTFSSQFFL